MKAKTAAQWEAVDRDQIPWVVIVAPDEMKDGKVRVKEQVGKAEAEGKGELVDRSQLVQYLQQRLQSRA